MTDTLKVAPDFATNPAKSAIPGARVDFRTIELLTTDLVTTQIIALGIIPASHRLLDFALETDDLDTGSTLTITVGLLNVVGRGGAWLVSTAATTPDSGDYAMGGSNHTPALIANKDAITADTIGRTGGRATSSLAFTEAIGVNHNYDRCLAVKFPAAPTGAVAGTLNLILTLDE